MKSGVAIRKSVIAYAAVISAIIIELFSQLLSILATKLPGNEALIKFSLSVVGYLLTYLVTTVVLQLLTNVKWIRINIFKEKIIEGDWIEIIYYDLERKRPFCYGWVKTYFDANGDLIYDGTDFDMINCRKTGTFNSTSSALKYDTSGNTAVLDYTYDFYNGSERQSGYGRIDFIVGKGSSDRHSGLFYNSDGKIFYFDAVLVESKKDRKALKKDETFISTFKKYINKIEATQKEQVDEMNYIYSHNPQLFEEFCLCEDYKRNLEKFFNENFDFRGKTVLDMGAGTGRFTQMIINDSAKNICTDESKKMVDFMKKKFASFGFGGKIDFYVCNHAMMPGVIKEKVDFLIAGYTIGSYFNNPELSLDECRKICEYILKICKSLIKKGGKLIIIENLSTCGARLSFDKNLDFYTSMLVENGFVKTEINTDFKFETIEDARYLINAFWGSEILAKIPKKPPFVISEVSGIFVKEF